MNPLLIAAMAAQAVTSIQHGNNMKAQYEAQAQANIWNSAVLRQKADSVNAATAQREDQQRRINRLQQGERYAAAAQSGAGLEGSNKDILEQSDVFAELNALNIRYEGALQKTSLLTQAAAETYQSRVNRFSGDIAQREGVLNAITGAASTYARSGGGGGYGSPGPG